MKKELIMAALIAAFIGASVQALTVRNDDALGITIVQVFKNAAGKGDIAFTGVYGKKQTEVSLQPNLTSFMVMGQTAKPGGEWGTLQTKGKGHCQTDKDFWAKEFDSGKLSQKKKLNVDVKKDNLVLTYL